MTLKIYPLPDIPVTIQCNSNKHWHDLQCWLWDNVGIRNYEFGDFDLNKWPTKTIYFTKQEDATLFALKYL